MVAFPHPTDRTDDARHRLAAVAFDRVFKPAAMTAARSLVRYHLDLAALLDAADALKAAGLWLPPVSTILPAELGLGTAAAARDTAARVVREQVAAGWLTPAEAEAILAPPVAAAGGES